MKIENIDIRFFLAAGMTVGAEHDLARHVKTLPWLSIVQSQMGSYGIALENGESRETGTGGFFIAPSQVTQTIVHHVDPATRTMICRWVFFDVWINQKYPLDSLYDFPMIPERADAEELNALFDRLSGDVDLCDKMSVGYQIIKILLRVGVPKNRIESERILAVINYISGHYQQKITVADLAAVAFLSESALYSLFRKETGQTPNAYLQNYRLSIASEMIRSTDLSIREISCSVGYSDPLYFSRIFQKAYHFAPTEYRERYKL